MAASAGAGSNAMPMQIMIICTALILLASGSAFTGSQASGWTPATATFYGGSDASGTMGDWTPASATFYGGGDGSQGMGGACGYGNMYSEGYGINNTALSTALFNDGAACGMCFQIVCDSTKSKWCKNTRYITVTATNFCPPNYNLPSDKGGWCNPPRKHFDMSQPAWESIAVYQGGIVPVYYRRVRCHRSGGLRFTINGNNYFMLVLVSNVGGSGVITRVWVSGRNTNWMVMGRNWGMNWDCNTNLRGQSLSFRVQTDDGRIRTAYSITPSSWSFGSTYSTAIQF